MNNHGDWQVIASRYFLLFIKYLFLFFYILDKILNR